MMTVRSRSRARVGTRVLALALLVGVVSSATGEADLSTLVAGRTWLLQGRDTYKLDGKNAAPDSVYGTDGPFRATFNAGQTCLLDNRPFGPISGTWTPGTGRNLLVQIPGDTQFFPFVYDAFLRSLILNRLRVREKLPIVEADVTITPTFVGGPLRFTAHVSPTGLQLTLRLRNKRRYSGSVMDPATGRMRRFRGVFQESGIFKGPLAQ